jgi:hypothetical protein
MPLSDISIRFGTFPVDPQPTLFAGRAHRPVHIGHGPLAPTPHAFEDESMPHRQCHPAVDGEIGEELLDLGRAHGVGMANVVKADEAFGPVE